MRNEAKATFGWRSWRDPILESLLAIAYLFLKSNIESLGYLAKENSRLTKGIEKWMEGISNEFTFCASFTCDDLL